MEERKNIPHYFNQKGIQSMDEKGETYFTCREELRFLWHHWAIKKAQIIFVLPDAVGYRRGMAPDAVPGVTFKWCAAYVCDILHRLDDATCDNVAHDDALFI